MSFKGQFNVAGSAAFAYQSVEKTPCLERDGAWVFVAAAVHDQYRFLDLICVIEGRNAGVKIRGFPERAALVLETERCQRAVIRALIEMAVAKRPSQIDESISCWKRFQQACRQMER